MGKIFNTIEDEEKYWWLCYINTVGNNMTNPIIQEQLDDIERVIKEQEDMANHIGNLEGDD